jgi:hypothetical protein
VRSGPYSFSLSLALHSVAFVCMCATQLFVCICRQYHNKDACGRDYPIQALWIRNNSRQYYRDVDDALLSLEAYVGPITVCVSANVNGLLHLTVDADVYINLHAAVYLSIESTD